MTSHRESIAIIGSGIIGLAHAFIAHQRGHTVTIIERDSRPTGASVQNFGHLCFTAQADALLPLTLSSRDGWIRAADSTGLPLVHSGTVAAARTEAELILLKNLHARRNDSSELLSAQDVRSNLGGLGNSDILGGLFLPLDLRANPRQAASFLAESLVSQGVEILHNTAAHHIEQFGEGLAVKTSTGSIRADRVIVATGHHMGQLFPELATEAGMQQCRLAMARVRIPGFASTSTALPALLTATSMTRYGAFTETVGAEDVARQVQNSTPELANIVANVMCTQLPDGSFIVGDSHHYDTTSSPFVDERVIDLLLTEFQYVLGVDHVDVIERWQGVYASSTKQQVYRCTPMSGVDVVTVTSGLGMTLSFGLARQTFEN